MSVFRTVTVFSKNGPGDIHVELNNNIAYLQVDYCLPEFSEYYELQYLVSPDLNYIEIHINYHDVDNFKQWHEIYGEIVQELVIEMKADFETYGVTMVRYIENVEAFGLPSDLDYSLFTSKLIDENGSLIKSEQ